jgi:hypothetical protein
MVDFHLSALLGSPMWISILLDHWLQTVLLLNHIPLCRERRLRRRNLILFTCRCNRVPAIRHRGHKRIGRIQFPQIRAQVQVLGTTLCVPLQIGNSPVHFISNL